MIMLYCCKRISTEHFLPSYSFLSRYKESLGFTARTVFLTKGDPMAREVLKFLSGFDIVVHESFGQAENCGLLTANIPKRLELLLYFVLLITVQDYITEFKAR